MTFIPRIAIWAAVSTTQQAQANKDSLPSQVQAGRAFADKIGGRVSIVYQIRGHTRKYIFFDAAERDIPEYARLRADCEGQEFDVLWCRARDRLGRTDALIAQVEALVTEVGGAEVYSAAMPHEVGQEGDGTSQIYLSAIERAQAESENVVRTRRTQQGIKARIERGLPMLWPYGYRPVRNAEGDVIAGEFHPAQAGAVRLITRLYLEGVGYRQIRKKLEASPWDPMRSHHWSHRTVSDIVHNDFYAGYVSYGEYESNGRSDKYPHFWDVDTHRRILEEHERRYQGRNPPATPVSGIVICRRCGWTMTACMSGQHRAYHCHNARYIGGIECHPNTVHYAVIRSELLAYLDFLSDERALEAALYTAAPERQVLEEEKGELQEYVADLDQRRKRLALAFSEGQMAVGVYRAADKDLLVSVEGASERLRELNEQLADLPYPEDRRLAVQSVVDLTRVNPGWIDEMPVEKARTALQQAGVKVYCEGGEVVEVCLE